MEAVMISIKPKHCELIARGKKIIEVKKTRPKLIAPFKCYICCTIKGDALCPPHLNCNEYAIHRRNNGTIAGRCMTEKERTKSDYKYANGKVIGEFVCDTYVTDKTFGHDELFNAATCMDAAEVASYMTKPEMYGWHISELKMYDVPKELSEFRKGNIKECWYADLGLAKRDCPDCRSADCFLQRPPKSWCYVERM